MYLEHFGLYTAPFSLVPHLRFLFQSQAFEETMAHLVYGLEGGEDFILITGEVGSGKTLALHNLTTHVASIYEKIVINVTQVDFTEFLKLILMELGVEAATGADRADLLFAFKKRVEALHAEGRIFLLIVDEAQNLELDVLEGVRLLANIGPSDRQFIQVILCGQPALRAKIDTPELVQLRQRIRVHYHLHVLTDKETAAYIDHRMKVAGSPRSPFTSDAVKKIHSLSGGIPRLVNVLADRALLDAFVDNSKRVLIKHVAEDDIALPPAEAAAAAARAAAASASIPAVPTASSARPREAEAERQPSRARTIPWLVATLLGIALIIILSGLWLGWWEHGAASAETEPMADVHSGVQDVGLQDDEASASDQAFEKVDSSERLDVFLNVDGAGHEPSETVIAAAEPSPGALEIAPEGTDTDLGSDIMPMSDLRGVVIHVGSYRVPERARQHVSQLKSRGYSTKIYQFVIDGTIWYRVYLGPWDNLDEAYQVESKLKQDGLVSWTMVVKSS